MNKLAIMMVAIALLSGCAATAKNVQDLSTGEKTAFIDGNHGGGAVKFFLDDMRDYLACCR